MRQTRLTIIAILLLPLWVGAVAQAREIKAQLLVYRVAEPESTPYISRLLVTPETLRIDQGEGVSGYILLERRSGVVYSINQDEQTILVIDPAPGQPRLPGEYRVEQRQLASQGMPKVAGRQPQHWRLLVDGQVCRDSILVPGLLPDASRAYADYLRVIARQQRAGLAATPAEFTPPCDRVMYDYKPALDWSKGVPLRQWRPDGWRQELLKFEPAFTLDPGLLQLPAGYRRLSMP